MMTCAHILRKASLFGGGLYGCLYVNSANAGDDGFFVEQDYLFLLEEAYTQEKGEWQASFAWDRGLDSQHNNFGIEFEYGITDRFQVTAELPLARGAGTTRAGDLEFAADYALLKEADGDIAELTLGVGASAPVGDDEIGAGEWGYEVSLRASKQLAPDIYGYLSWGYEWLPNGGREAQYADEWIFGVGAAWRAADDVIIISEYLRARESEQGLFEDERETQTYFSGGIAIEIVDDVLLGAAGAVGLNDNSETRFLAKLQAEW